MPKAKIVARTKTKPPVAKVTKAPVAKGKMPRLKRPPQSAVSESWPKRRLWPKARRVNRWQ
jgi:hypothetical protein